MAKRDNLGRFRKYATATLTNDLKNIAIMTNDALKKEIGDELKATYRYELINSYSPRSSSQMKYEHLNLLLENIDIDPNTSKDTVKIKINEKYYPYVEGFDDEKISPRSTLDVYRFLTEGTVGGGKYPYYNDREQRIAFAENLPTPKHPFDSNTQRRMNTFIAQLRLKVKDPSKLARYIKFSTTRRLKLQKITLDMLLKK